MNKKKRILVSFTCILVALLSIVLYIIDTTYETKSTEGEQLSPIPSPTQTINMNNLINGQWQYMPGVKKQTDGLLVQPINFALVEQNGAFAQTNPPINLAGTHLEQISGDFTLTTNVNLLTSQKAIIQFYGQPPIIADEFRIERDSVRLALTQNTLTVTTWNTQGKSTGEKTFTFPTQKESTIGMSRQGSVLTFTVNGKVLGNVSGTGIFSSGNVWFGLDGGDKSWLLTNLEAKGTLTVVDASKMRVNQHDPNGLQALASKKRPGFIVGMSRALGPLTSDNQYINSALDSNMFGSLTAENEMKMINVQPQRGVFTFGKGDAMVRLAKQNGISVHGHTLVFAEANPPWFNALPVKTAADKQQIEQIMLNHVTTVVKHFGTNVASWDVINEPMADYGGSPDGNVLRNHKWYQAMGEAYISKALIAANKANPNATLFINEYGLETDGERWNAFVALLKRLKPQLQAQGVPTDKIGVGFQAHVFEAGDRIAPATLQRHIRQLATLGYKTQVSEMDVYSDDGSTIQAQQYTDIFNACLNEPNCVAWRGWILSDRYDYWKDDDGQIYDGIDGLFDKNMKPRPALVQMQTLLTK